VRSSYETVDKTLTLLNRLGLILIHEEPEFPFKKMCELSERGRTLVQTPVYKWPALLWEEESES